MQVSKGGNSARKGHSHPHKKIDHEREAKS